MMKISLIQPARNNLKYLKWSYSSIRKNSGNHIVEICVADDFSNDGTWEWCNEMMKSDPNFKAIRNNGPVRLGHTILYDRLVNEVATSDICMIYHADMYLCPNAIDEIEKYIKPKTIVSLTRIEPPLHPDGPEKVLSDWGVEPEQFNELDFLNWFNGVDNFKNNEITEGIFAPWAFYKSDFLEIGGHDSLYAPQSKEDSDIFNRFQLNGVNFIQTWKGCVYHMTCRGSRFNPLLTQVGKNSNEWEAQNIRSSRNFIRKWGHFVKHDEFMKPIIPHKYGVGLVVKNCNLDLLRALEPWCDKIYIEDGYGMITTNYIDAEQKNTKFDLSKRIRLINHHDPICENDIVVEFDGTKLNENNFIFIERLSEILTENEISVGYYEMDIFKFHISSVRHYENDLIKIANNYA